VLRRPGSYEIREEIGRKGEASAKNSVASWRLPLSITYTETICREPAGEIQRTSPAGLPEPLEAEPGDLPQQAETPQSRLPVSLLDHGDHSPGSKVELRFYCTEPSEITTVAEPFTGP
jgi:hypothetical protein